MNECLNLTLCQNNALCINTQGSFTCQCQVGWEGKYCHIGTVIFTIKWQIDGQQRNIFVWNLNLKVWFITVVKDHVIMITKQSWYYTMMYRTWTNHSFPDINECLVNNPCLNDAICENTPGSYICRCKPGFEGNLCQYSEYMNSIHTYNVHVHNHVFYQISLLHV